MDRYTGKRFAHANPQLCGAELEIPLAHRGWVPGVTETVGSGANLGLLRTLSPPERRFFFELSLLLRVGLLRALAPSLELSSQLVAHPTVDGGIGGLYATLPLQPRLGLAVTSPAVRVAELLLQRLADFGGQLARPTRRRVVLQQSLQSLLLVEPEPAVEGGLVAAQG